MLPLAVLLLRGRRPMSSARNRRADRVRRHIRALVQDRD